MLFSVPCCGLFSLRKTGGICTYLHKRLCHFPSVWQYLAAICAAVPGFAPVAIRKNKAASLSRGSPPRAGLSPPVAWLGYILPPAFSSASLMIPSIVRVAALIASSTTPSGVAAVMYFTLFSSNASTR